MKLSNLFSKTTKQDPKDETYSNSRLLLKAGYVDKVAAGVYTYLPLGKLVLDKISQIVRQEMNEIGGQEVTMPVLAPKVLWETTGRWKDFDVLFKIKGAAGEFALGATHEEIVTPLAQRFISTYRDLPKYVYQIQTKFRDEPRTKSGLLRGREFLMKDLYSFHATEQDLDVYYQKVMNAYEKIFKRLGLDTILTEAGGGTFSKYSHEYQVECEAGEDTIYVCRKDHFARNKEVIEEGDKCPKCGEKLEETKGAEVGNIFKLKTKYSDPFGLKFTDQAGKQHLVLMGCYGLGISRVMATIVEVSHDGHGIIWPKAVAPFKAHLVQIGDDENSARDFSEACTKSGLGKEDILWDDRQDVSVGEKFADADLLGIPVRLVVSQKIGKGKVEWKERSSDKSEVIDLDSAIKKLQ